MRFPKHVMAAARSQAKTILTRVYSKNIDDMLETVQQFDIISFDIYDTLIDREVEDRIKFFSLVVDRIEEKVGIDCEILPQSRIDVEKQLYAISQGYEISLEQIYGELLPDAPEDIIRRCCEVEMSCEVALSKVNLRVLDIYNKIAENNKTIILISDMYLPKIVIERILEKNHIAKFKKLYLSSDYGVTKRSGKLFRLVSEEMNASPSSMIHIGNDFISDYTRARNVGLSTYLIDSDSRFEKNYLVNQKIEPKESGFLSGFISNSERPAYSVYEKIGYEVLGPLLLSFSFWISSKASNNTDEVFLFLTREGVLIHDSVEIVDPVLAARSAIIHVSRRSLIGCMLADVNSVDDLLVAMQPITEQKLSLREVLDAGFICMESVQRLHSMVNVEDDIEIPNYSDEQKNCFDECILPEIRLYGRKQKERFLRYFGSIVDDAKRVSIVDVGWRGTMQDMIARVIREEYPDVSLCGYYYGVHSDARISNQTMENKFGLLYQDCLQKSERFFEISLTGQIFEMLFLGCQGTTVSYSERDGIVIPVHETNELSRRARYTTSLIQRGALTFVQDYLNSGLFRFCKVIPSVEEAYSRYRTFAVQPTLRTINLFKHYSTKNVKAKSLLSDKSGLYWIIHPARFYEAFSSCYCKVFFLKSAFILPFPYFRFLRWLKRCQNQ